MSEVLIIGSGGREYELARSIGLANEVDRIQVAPGNAGTELLPKTENVTGELNYLDKLVVIGPEQPLVQGLADEIRGQGGLVFGPSKEAARLEGSKAHASRFMQKHHIPHAVSTIVDDLAYAEQIIRSRPAYDYVLKADGLADGKGVVLPRTQSEAVDAVRNMLSGAAFGDAGRTILFQERLHGPEISAMVVSDGTDFVLLPLAQDHKRLRDGDAGPNTGGMGTYVPVPKTIVSTERYKKIYTIAKNSLAAMQKEGTPFQGVLFMGIVLAKEYDSDPIVIEYNVRFGDPEAQAILPLLGDKTYGLLRSAAEGRLQKSGHNFRYLGRAALTVCLAAENYPRSPRLGDAIHGLDREYQNVIVHHGGTEKHGNQIVTAGGRALYVTGLGKTVDAAAAAAYAAIGRDNIWFDGMQFRKDIGHQARTI